MKNKNHLQKTIGDKLFNQLSVEQQDSLSGIVGVINLGRVDIELLYEYMDE